MQIIRKLSDYLEEELDGAYDYAMCSLKHKEDDPLLAKMFYDMSVDEMKHVNQLHEEAVRQINIYKNAGEEVPESMQAIYDYLHEKHIEYANEIKLLQAQYRG